MPRQRLILCLDGTWNNEDDSTNVLHHFNLVESGPVKDGWVQEKKYQRGVGTGVLDSISGGGFGFGLEEHVREAYSWLVQHYQEDDEIYVFGFSRGAFTARSLVGFIGASGLLRRAAPITVGQLWSCYRRLGREREERLCLTSKTGDTFREITDLVKDPWLALDEKVGPDGVRGQLEEPANDAERLLVRWSRRVRITYLGVYDTVGAIGWDALAFPILKSRLAMHHNLRPTTLIQNCRHALAIQEHRTSFNHTPFVAFLGHSDCPDELVRMGHSAPDADPWQETIDKWNRRIEQRWFAGAHSNIGGGYKNNRLAEKPFEWMLDGATHLGLQCEPRPQVPCVDSPLPPAKDSYAEFVPPLWAMILRAKRNYRVINPPAEPRASLHSSSGFSLQTINEIVDDSVPQYFTQTQQPLPPNLFVWARANRKQFPQASEPKHTWFGNGWKEPFALALWASLAAVGFVALCKFVSAEVTSPVIATASVVAFFGPIADWIESIANFRLALGRTRPWRKALAGTIYWTRAFLVVFFFLGAFHFLVYFWSLGWSNGMAAAFSAERREIHWLMPVFAVAGVTLANALDGACRARWKPTLLALGAALAAAPLAALVLLAVSSGLHSLFPAWEPAAFSTRPHSPATERAALLLLLQFAFFYFVRAFTWAGEPLSRANLGSILALQKCFTAAQVSKCLEDWRRKLASPARPEDPVTGPAACKVRDVVREALWRDILGFIPAYSLALGFGLWFAARHLHWGFLQDRGGIPMWPVLPVVALVADYFEDAVHLGYLRSVEHRQKPSLAWFAWGMTGIKVVAFLGESLLTVGAIVLGTRAVIADGPQAGWSGTAALLAFGIGFAAVLLHIIKKVQRRFF